jgi:hypothetical protein
MNRIRRVVHIVRSIPVALDLLAGDADPYELAARADVFITSLLIAFAAAIAVVIAFCTIAHL